jgi:hypothetical protein
MRSREETLHKIENRSFDVCVIGGRGNRGRLRARCAASRTADRAAGSRRFCGSHLQQIHEDYSRGSALSRGGRQGSRPRGKPGCRPRPLRTHSHVEERPIPFADSGVSHPLLPLAGRCLLRRRAEDVRLDCRRDEHFPSDFFSRDETLRMPTLKSEELVGPLPTPMVSSTTPDTTLLWQRPSGSLAGMQRTTSGSPASRRARMGSSRPRRMLRANWAADHTWNPVMEASTGCGRGRSQNRSIGLTRHDDVAGKSCRRSSKRATETRKNAVRHDDTVDA